MDRGGEQRGGTGHAEVISIGTASRRNDTRTMVSYSHPINTAQKIQTVLLLRWVLIVATSYLVLFSRPLSQLPLGAALFIAAYFGSNIVAGALLPRISDQPACEVALVLFDVIMVSVGLALTPTASSQFFVVYFVVVFLSALSERLGLVVGAALLVSATHLYTTSQFIGWGQLLADGYALRVPFLFVVALFFGYLVAEARQRERDAEEARKRQLRAEFSSALMHDLKNSLGVVESLAIMLLDGEAGPLNPEQVDFTRRIHASARHLITFALNLIDAARIEAGELVRAAPPDEPNRRRRERAAVGAQRQRPQGCRPALCGRARPAAAVRGRRATGARDLESARQCHQVHSGRRLGQLIRAPPERCAGAGFL